MCFTVTQWAVKPEQIQRGFLSASMPCHVVCQSCSQLFTYRALGNTVYIYRVSCNHKKRTLTDLCSTLRAMQPCLLFLSYSFICVQIKQSIAPLNMTSQNAEKVRWDYHKLTQRNDYLNKMIKDIMNLSSLVTFVSIPAEGKFWYEDPPQRRIVAPLPFSPLSARAKWRPFPRSSPRVGGGCRALGRMRTSRGEPLSADLRSLPLLAHSLGSSHSS